MSTCIVCFSLWVVLDQGKLNVSSANSKALAKNSQREVKFSRHLCWLKRSISLQTGSSRLGFQRKTCKAWLRLMMSLIRLGFITRVTGQHTWSPKMLAWKKETTKRWTSTNRQDYSKKSSLSHQSSSISTWKSIIATWKPQASLASLRL